MAVSLWFACLAAIPFVTASHAETVVCLSGIVQHTVYTQLYPLYTPSFWFLDNVKIPMLSHAFVKALTCATVSDEKMEVRKGNTRQPAQLTAISKILSLTGGEDSTKS